MAQRKSLIDLNQSQPLKKILIVRNQILVKDANLDGIRDSSAPNPSNGVENDGTDESGKPEGTPVDEGNKDKKDAPQPEICMTAESWKSTKDALLEPLVKLMVVKERTNYDLAKKENEFRKVVETFITERAKFAGDDNDEENVFKITFNPDKGDNTMTLMKGLRSVLKCIDIFKYVKVAEGPFDIEILSLPYSGGSRATCPGTPKCFPFAGDYQEMINAILDIFALFFKDSPKLNELIEILDKTTLTEPSKAIRPMLIENFLDLFRNMDPVNPPSKEKLVHSAIWPLPLIAEAEPKEVRELCLALSTHIGIDHEFNKTLEIIFTYLRNVLICRVDNDTLLADTPSFRIPTEKLQQVPNASLGLLKRTELDKVLKLVVFDRQSNPPKEKVQKSKKNKLNHNVQKNLVEFLDSRLADKSDECFLNTVMMAFIEFLYNYFALNGEDAQVLQALDTIRNEVKSGAFTLSKIHNAWGIIILNVKDASILGLVESSNSSILEASLAPSVIFKDIAKNKYFNILRKFDRTKTLALLGSETLADLFDNLKDFDCDVSKFTVEDVKNYFFAIRKIVGRPISSSSVEYLKNFEECFQNSTDLKSSMDFMRGVLNKSLKRFPGRKPDLSILDPVLLLVMFYQKIKETKKADEYLEFSRRLNIILGLELDDDPSNAKVFDAFAEMQKNKTPSTLASFLKALYDNSPDLLSKLYFLSKHIGLNSSMTKRYLDTLPKIAYDFDKLGRNMLAWKSHNDSIDEYWAFPFAAEVIDGDMLPLLFPEFELPSNFNYTESQDWKEYVDAYLNFINATSGGYFAYNFSKSNSIFILPNVEIIKKHIQHRMYLSNATSAEVCGVLLKKYEKLIGVIDKEGKNPHLVAKMREHLAETRTFFGIH